MHCPRCGQQQISEETKFCSKCGLPLTVVAVVMNHGGSLPQLDLLAQQKGKRKWLNKKNGMIFSAFWFFIFTVVLTSFLGVLGAPGALIGLFALKGVFGGFLIFLFSAIFLPSSRPKFPYNYPYPLVPHQMPNQMGGQTYQPGALPQQQSAPVSSYTPPPHVAGSWRDTNDLGRGSVIEGTTRLLQKEEDQ
jgi:hypothetical protein